MSAQLPLTGLYVPGDRPDRFDKAVASGAEMVILDLEDAVAEKHKSVAREAVVEWLGSRPGPNSPASASPIIQVRVNADFNDDLAALAQCTADFELRVPKVESAVVVDEVALRMPGRPQTALLESALGIENALLIAQHPAVTRLAIGESDLASELGTRSARVMAYARSRVLFASHAASLDAPMLSAYPAIRDLEGLRADTAMGRDDGWVGRVAIHPAQLQVIREVFVATPAEVAWAEEVLAALSHGGVVTLANGEMVDSAMRGLAERILRRRDPQ